MLSKSSMSQDELNKFNRAISSLKSAGEINKIIHNAL